MISSFTVTAVLKLCYFRLSSLSAVVLSTITICLKSN